MGSVGVQPFQLEDVRARLRKMSDADLLRFGRPPQACAGRMEISGIRRARYSWTSYGKRARSGGAGIPSGESVHGAPSRQSGNGSGP
jgi:hypothetical protein